MLSPLQISPVCLASSLRCSYCSRKALQGKNVYCLWSMSPTGHEAGAKYRGTPVSASCVQDVCYNGCNPFLTMLFAISPCFTLILPSKVHIMLC